MSVFDYIYIQTARPGGKKYPDGMVEMSHYKLVDDGLAVVLCSPKGGPTSKRRVLQPGETAREGAVQLLRAKIRGDRGDRPRGFGKPIQYGDPIKY